MMANDNDTPFDKLDVDSLLNIREWVRKACVAAGAKFMGGGVGIRGDMGMADIDIEVDGCAFNIEITPRPRRTP
jgi:hypothetical protein